MRKRLLLGHDIYKSNKTTVGFNFSWLSFKFLNRQEREGPRDQNATAVCEIDTAPEADAQAQFERAQRDMEYKRAHPEDKTYRGLAAVDCYQPTKDSVIGNAKCGFVRFVDLLKYLLNN